MRRAYRRPYSLPSHLTKTRKDKEDKDRAPLVQPDWDDTIHDLTALKASLQEVLRRKLSRTSHNQMGMALLAKQCRRSGQSGGQERYTPSASLDESSDEDSAAAKGRQSAQRQQQRHSPAAASQHSAKRFGMQQHADAHMQRQQQEHRSGSVLAQYACSTSDSEEDVCQWQSPVRPAAQQWHQQQQRHVLHDIQNSPQRDVGAGLSAVRHHKHSSWQQQQQQSGQYAGQRDSGPTTFIDASSMQVLLDKINMLEQQLYKQADQQQEQPEQQQEQEQSSPDLRQLLLQSQRQLAATQQELHKLQEEHRQYVAHTSTLLTQLQTQVQTLLTGHRSLPPLPDLQQQQQQVPPAGPHYSRNLQPAPFGRQQFEEAGVGDSSTVRVQQISSYIREQLQEQQQPEAPAGARPYGGSASVHSSRSTGLRNPSAATTKGSPSKAAGSPSKAVAGRLAGSTAGSACSSPSRRRADLQFTPAVADTLALPSYAAMRKHTRAGGSPTRFKQAGLTGAAGMDPQSSTGAGAAGYAVSASAERVQLASSSRGVDVGSPKQLHTTPVPQPLPASGLGAGTSIAKQGLSGLPGFASRTISHHDAAQLGDAAQPLLAVRLPSSRVAAAAVWEAELASPSCSDRPQQMQFQPEAMQYHLSSAAGESVHRPTASPAVLSNELATLLRSLGLGDLDLQAVCAADSARASGGASQQQPLGSAHSSAQGLNVGASGNEHNQHAGSKAAVLLSEAAAAPAAATAPRLLSASRGDGVLTGLHDVDRGLLDALPQAAVSRVFTAAGCVSDRGEGLAPRPRVLAEQLKGNVCLRDHMRAAATAAAQAGAH